MKINIESLGCRLNQAELQSIITRLIDNGHEIISSHTADVFIINSCVVTHASEKKTKKLIEVAQKNVSSDGHIIITGCFADSYRIEGNKIYLSNDYKYLIPDVIELQFIIPDNLFIKSRFNYSPAIGSIRTRINLKIQDGCDNYCSYCIIPYVRGNPISRPMINILDEFKTLIRSGYREFILTGVMISNYNYNGIELHHLIQKLLEIEGDYRIHLSSLSPSKITPELILLLSHKKIVKHLHLSLQSGSDEILKAMNRHYSALQFLTIVNKIKTLDSLFNFTTDLIVGFPGENDQHFKETLSLLKKVSFSHIHTFRYSKREGTKAASLQNQIPESIKKERSKRIIEIYSNQKNIYYRKFNTKNSQILTESIKADYTTGYNQYYIPVLTKGQYTRNQFIDVQTEFDENTQTLIGTPINNT